MSSRDTPAFSNHRGLPVAVSSCTAALHLALKAVGIEKDDEVITVSHSFISTANSIRYCGANPVFVDIEPETYNIDPNLIEEAISNKTKAILCVHQMGMPCDLNAILKIAKQYSLAVIEDAACAAGSEIKLGNKWEKIGLMLIRLQGKFFQQKMYLLYYTWFEKMFRH